jgi:hypothetical protein
MDSTQQHIHLKNFIAFSLLFNVISGLASEVVTAVDYKHFAWAVSAFFMIIASSLLGSKLTRAGQDLPAAGFIIMSIAQAASYAFIATHDAGQEQFTAVIAIFVPGLLLISLYDVVPFFIRVAGFLAAAAFSVLGIIVYKEVFSDTVHTVLTSGSYMLMNVVILGWAWLVYKNKI